MLDKYGLDAENLHDIIRDEIRESPLFRFDWFFLSRTSLEISRRCNTLILTVQREFEELGIHIPGVGVLKKKVTHARDDEEEDHGDAPPAKKGKTNTAVVANGKPKVCAS
jgi:SWI/SNF-related matrix-associated actin-dependent regulator of chromatin subfamily A member 5